MSRHYGTAIESDFEPDTREPDPDQAAVDQFYADLLWEPNYNEVPKHHEEMK